MSSMARIYLEGVSAHSDRTSSLKSQRSLPTKSWPRTYFEVKNGARFSPNSKTLVAQTNIACDSQHPLWRVLKF